MDPKGFKPKRQTTYPVVLGTTIKHQHQSISIKSAHRRQIQFASIMGTQGNVILIDRMWKKTALSSKWVKKSELSKQWLATTPQTMHAYCEAMMYTARIATQQLGLMAFCKIYTSDVE